MSALGKLAKCTEAQALRKAWPEIGQEATAEEMMGKDFHADEKDITPSSSSPSAPVDNNQLVQIITQGIKAIETGKKTPEQIIKFIKNKNLDLSTEQEATLQAVKVAA